MADWWEKYQLAPQNDVTSTGFAQAPMPAPAVAQAPPQAPPQAAPQAPPQAPPSMAPGSAGAQIYAPRPPQSAFAGLPPEILMLSGMVGPNEGMKFLSPFLSAPPVEVMGPDGRPQYVQRHQAFGMPSPKTMIDMKEFDLKNINQPVSIGGNGAPTINQMLGQTPEFLLKLAQAGAQIRNTQSEIANRPIQPGGPDGGTGAVNPAWAAMESLKLGQANTEKAYEGIVAGGTAARSAMSTVNQLNTLLEQVNTGRLTTTTTGIKALAKGLGIDLEKMGIRDDVGPAQAAMALSNQLALTLRNPAGGAGMPGALSDSDRNFLASMTPSIEGTPEGRVLMVDWAKRMYQHQIELTRVANAYMQSKDAATNPRGLQIALQSYSDANPIFSPADAARIKELSSRPAAAPSVTVPMPAAPGAAPASPLPTSGQPLRYIPGKGIQ